MSTIELLASTEKLLKLHTSLYDLALKKTDIIKKGDMDALNQMLKDEQSHISAIEQMERKRQLAAKALIQHMERPAVNDCLTVLRGDERDKFSQTIEELSNIIHLLKEQNYLNQQLIHHSMQFVQFSMGLLRPQSAEINYKPPAKKSPEHSSLGIFNSKA